MHLTYIKVRIHIIIINVVKISTRRYLLNQRMCVLIRRYRQSKFYPQCAIIDSYAVICKWKEGSCNNTGNFIMPRHGNAKSSSVLPYYFQDPDFSRREATTVSQTIRDPKVISNRRYYAKHCGKSVDFGKGEEETEAQQILKYVKEDDFIRTVTTEGQILYYKCFAQNDERGFV